MLKSLAMHRREYVLPFGARSCHSLYSATASLLQHVLGFSIVVVGTAKLDNVLIRGNGDIIDFGDSGMDGTKALRIS